MALLLGAFARLLSFPRVFAGNKLSFVGGPDAYCHLRRAELVLAGKLADVDQWANYPFGADVSLLPHAYSHILAFAMSHFGNIGLLTFPLLCGLLSIVVLKSLSDKFPSASFIMILYSVMPIVVILSSWGAIDHHCVEALCLVLALRGRRWYGVALLGSWLTTTTWPVIAMVIVVTEAIRSRIPWLQMLALVIGPLGLLIAGRSFFMDPWQNEIKEMKSLLAGSEGLTRSLTLMSVSLICIPWALHVWWKSRALDHVASLLSAALVTFPLALLHARFAIFLAVPGVFAMGEVLQSLRERFHRVISVAFIAASFTWIAIGLASIPNSAVDPPLAIRRALDVMRQVTPTPGDYLAPQQQPDYGVAAAWDLGHAITALAMRPAVASPYLSGNRGRDLMRNIFFSEPRIASEIADKHAARYLLLTKLRVAAGPARSLYERLYYDHDTQLGWDCIYQSPEIFRLDGVEVPAVQIWERNTGTVY